MVSYAKLANFPIYRKHTFRNYHTVCPYDRDFGSNVSLYRGEEYLIYQVFACQKQPFTKKILKQFLYKYVPWAIPATPRMAKMNGNRNLCAPKLIGTHSWLTPWCCPMSDPSSDVSRLERHRTNVLLVRLTKVRH